MKKGFTLLMVLCLLTILLAVPAFAADEQPASGAWGDLTWHFDPQTDTLTISGNGEMQGTQEDKYPWVPYKTYISHVVIEDGVTSLAGSAFRDYESLRTVSIPSSVKDTGSMAFYDCNRLEEVHLAEGLTEIGKEMFTHCPMLKTVKIPSTVEVIGGGAFGSTSLSAVELPLGLREIGKSAFIGTKLTALTIPDGVTTIGEMAFYRCEQLENVQLPAGCTSLGEQVFAVCSSLKRIDVAAKNSAYCSVNGVLYNKEQTVLMQVPALYEGELQLPVALETIQDWALYECARITAYRIDETNPNFHGDAAGVLYSKDPLVLLYAPKKLSGEYSVEKHTSAIAERAFSGCRALETVNLPEGLTTLGSYIFSDCEQLKEVQIPESVTSIMEMAFRNCKQLEQIYIPDTVTTIMEDAFRGCDALREVKLPQNLQLVEYGLFFECKNLTEITIPKGVATIGEYAFYGCEKLQYVFIPDTVTNIERNAFYGCSGLTDVFYEGTEEEWARMPVADGNEWLEHVRVHFTADSIAPDVIVPTPAPTPIPTPRPAEMSGAYALQKHMVNLNDSVLTQTYWKKNGNSQSYGLTTEPVGSYIAYENGKYLCVQGQNKGISVQWFDSSFTLLETKELALELPVYGGVYIGEDYNFVVCGQGNPTENDKQEVIRVIRYSKDWQREASASVYGANTFAPFAAAAVRFARSGDLLYIHTGHEMYEEFDGLNHQANMTISVRVSDTTIEKVCHWEGEDGYGSVGHSFNQFIIADGNDVIALDQGDANPRGLILSKYRDGAGSALYAKPLPTGEGTNLERAKILNIAENVGIYQATGVEVSGFEASATHYLTAGVSCPQTGGIEQRTAQQNVFVAIMDKNDVSNPAAKTIWYTDYAEGSDTNVSAPHLVKIRDDRFCLMWTVGKTLYYCLLDGAGQAVSDVRYTEGALSDCKPIVVGDSIVWYVLRFDSNKRIMYRDFYRIPLTEKAVHLYKNGVCALCGKSDGTNPFVDVAASDWFCAPVLWAVEQGVTGGTSPNTFSPEASCTRAQVVTFLWAAAGKPAPDDRQPL